MSRHEEFCSSMREQMTAEDGQDKYLLCRTAAEQGKAWAFREMGRCALEGVGECVNEEKARRYFEEAARRGDAKAWRYLAYCAAAGIGGEEDDLKMTEMLKRGAEAGDSEAQRLLGVCYLKMEPPQMGIAKKWLEKAMDQGNEEAGEMYRIL